MYEQIVAVYVEFLQGAIPFAIVFGFGNKYIIFSSCCQNFFLFFKNYFSTIH